MWTPTGQDGALQPADTADQHGAHPTDSIC